MTKPPMPEFQFRKFRQVRIIMSWPSGCREEIETIMAMNLEESLILLWVLDVEAERVKEHNRIIISSEIMN